MEVPSVAAPAGSTESSDELSVAAGVEGLSVASPGSHQCQPEMPPGVGNAPDVPGTASDVVEGEGIPATAEQEGQDQRTGAGKTIDLNDQPDLQLPGEYNHPLCQPNHTFLDAARFHLRNSRSCMYFLLSHFSFYFTLTTLDPGYRARMTTVMGAPQGSSRVRAPPNR